MTESHSLAAVDESREVASVTPQTRIVSQQQRNGFNYSPQNAREAMDPAVMMSRSGMVPKEYAGQPEKILVAIAMGAEVGMSPLASLQGIAVINGRPSMYGDAIIGLVRSNAVCEFIVEEESGTGDDYGWTVTGKRRGDANLISNRFTVADAKRANLWAKQGPWEAYPQRMLKMRARAWTCRDGFADVLKGLAMREEVIDLPESETLAAIRSAPDRTSAVKIALAARAPKTVAQVDVTTDAPTTDATTQPDGATMGAGRPDFAQMSPRETGECIKRVAAENFVSDDELRRIAADLDGGKLTRATAGEAYDILLARGVEAREADAAREAQASADDAARVDAGHDDEISLDGTQGTLL